MQDKKELSEKELLKVTGGTEQSASGENTEKQNDSCDKYKDKDSCKADPKCNWSFYAVAGCYAPEG